MSGSRTLGLLLAWVSAATLLWDERLRHQAQHLQRTQPEAWAKTLGYVAVLALMWGFLRLVRDSGTEFPLGRWHISLEAVFRPLAAFTGTYLLWYLIDKPQTRTLLADPENPLRLAGIIAGFLLAKAGGWRPQQGEPAPVPSAEATSTASRRSSSPRTD
ncbi:hypothetical protein [Streptomyces sp. NBC_00576]|uniref:hypothetical protein n=1 Tax=Streptomyces sp. NBC_00576 TaxID=2903665 RepID=UPI002E8039F9|nr:hypothetical protein [Streptomyces sp. NBC_00576]WUB76915.1 hypothetical protein OG734_46595 [Streptomyces sp. NBC_00576]